MFGRWCMSASIYGFGEWLSTWWKKSEVSTKRVATIMITGATVDSICLRAFHVAIDARIPSPFIRMLCEQATCAPLYDAGYLTLVKGSEWTWDEWWSVYRKDCAFWPMASYIGYRFVATERRYLYVSCATLAWSTWRASIVNNS